MALNCISFAGAWAGGCVRRPLHLDGEQSLLRAWAGGAAGLRLARRAWIVLADRSGQRTDRFFEATPLPSRTVQQVLKAYREMGALGLIDAPRAGRPPGAGTRRCVVSAAAEPDVDGSSSCGTDLCEAAHARWRAARRACGDDWVAIRRTPADGGRRRHRVQELGMCIEPPLDRVVGIAVDRGTCIVASIEDRKVRDCLSPVGFWLVPDRRVVASIVASRRHRPDWSMALAEVVDHRALAPAARPADEQRLPFATLVHSFPREAMAHLSLTLVGDPKSKGLVQWMTAIRGARESMPGRAFTPRVGFSYQIAKTEDDLLQLLGARLGPAVARACVERRGVFFWVRVMRLSEAME